MLRRKALTGAILTAMLIPAMACAQTPASNLNALIAKHAKANGVPEELVHRIVHEESRYQPRAVGRGGAMGLMQIKYTTARGIGYRGSASGLLDEEGYFWHRTHQVRAALQSHAACPEAARTELAAQIDHAHTFGLTFTHLDAHMGAACLPEVRSTARSKCPRARRVAPGRMPARPIS